MLSEIISTIVSVVLWYTSSTHIWNCWKESVSNAKQTGEKKKMEKDQQYLINSFNKFRSGNMEPQSNLTMWKWKKKITVYKNWTRTLTRINNCQFLLAWSSHSAFIFIKIMWSINFHLFRCQNLKWDYNPWIYWI